MSWPDGEPRYVVRTCEGRLQWGTGAAEPGLSGIVMDRGECYRKVREFRSEAVKVPRSEMGFFIGIHNAEKRKRALALAYDFAASLNTAQADA